MSEYWQPRRETRAQAVARINAEHGWPDAITGMASPTLPTTAADRVAWAKKVAERFAPDMSPGAVIDRLHIEVGDPEADGDWGDGRDAA